MSAARVTCPACVAWDDTTRPTTPACACCAGRGEVPAGTVECPHCLGHGDRGGRICEVCSGSGRDDGAVDIQAALEASLAIAGDREALRASQRTVQATRSAARSHVRELAARRARSIALATRAANDADGYEPACLHCGAPAMVECRCEARDENAPAEALEGGTVARWL